MESIDFLRKPFKLVFFLELLMTKQSLLRYWKNNKIVSDNRVIEAFKKVPREDFVLTEYKHMAYDDVALRILEGQTISQPTTVVMMLEALELKQGMKVLEIGAGSGYNAALMSEIVGQKGKIITTEIILKLASMAKNNLKDYKNVKVLGIDASKGYAKEAPYDRIICTAAAPKIHDASVKQLKEGGIIVVPVGPAFGQIMIKGKKVKGELQTQELGEFAFVPLTGKGGQLRNHDRCTG